MPKLRPTKNNLIPPHDGDGKNRSTTSRENSPPSATSNRNLSSSPPSSTPLKSPISNSNSTIKASLEEKFKSHLNNGARNGSSNNSLNNNNNNYNNYNSKFNTINPTRWKVSPSSPNANDSSKNDFNATTNNTATGQTSVNSYCKGPAPSVPSNMAGITNSPSISNQSMNSITNSNSTGTRPASNVNRSKSFGVKQSHRPAPPPVKPPPPPKMTSLSPNSVSLQSNTTSIAVNGWQPNTSNANISRRTSLDPSSVAEEGSSSVGSPNKPSPPPRQLPVTNGPAPPPPLHGRATGNTGLSSGLSKSQSSINGPSRPSAPPPPPPHLRTPSNVSVSSSHSTILKPSYPAPPPPPFNPSAASHRASICSTTSTSTITSTGQMNGALSSSVNISRGELETILLCFNVFAFFTKKWQEKRK